MKDRKEKEFTDILTSYRNKIHRLCHCYIKNEEDRQDLLNDIFIRIWKGLDSFQSKSSISTWIYKITVNSCIDFLRTEKKRRHRVSKIPLELMQLSDTSSNIEKKFILSQQIQILYNCIDRLTFLDKTIISLYLEDLSYEEIAEVVGISENHVGVKLHRIKKSVNSCLEEY